MKFAGDLFDIKGFHSVVLDNGAVPLDVLHDLVEEWIHEQVEGTFYCWFKQYFICKYIQHTTYTCPTNTSNIQKGSRRKSNDLFESVSPVY